MVYQDPMSSLNPLQDDRPPDRRGDPRPRARRPERGARSARSTCSATSASRTPTRRFDSYPHQFSGGMRQRVMIAMAICANPDVLIADEPTTALDVTTQARIMDLLDRLVEERGMAVILITHDLGLAAQLLRRHPRHVRGPDRRARPRRDRLRPARCIRTPRRCSTRSAGSITTSPRADRRDLGTAAAAAALPAGCPFHPRCAVRGRAVPRERAGADPAPRRQLGGVLVRGGTRRSRRMSASAARSESPPAVATEPSARRGRRR